jgi:hypothetical protein
MCYSNCNQCSSSNGCSNPCYLTSNPGNGCFIRYQNYSNCCEPTPAPITRLEAIGNGSNVIVPSGGGPVPTNNTGITGLTVVIPNSYTQIVSQGVTLSPDGVATVSSAGTYIIVADGCFADNGAVAVGDVRVFYVYKVNSSGTVQMVTMTNTPTNPTPTCFNGSAVVDLLMGDRIFVGVRQTSASLQSTDFGIRRLTITKL